MCLEKYVNVEQEQIRAYLDLKNNHVSFLSHLPLWLPIRPVKRATQFYLRSTLFKVSKVESSRHKNRQLPICLPLFYINCKLPGLYTLRNGLRMPHPQ